MRYFLLKKDENITDAPMPLGFFDRFDIRDITYSRAGKIPPRTLLKLKPNKYTVFPDVLCYPTLLVNQDARDVFDIYDEYTVYKQVVYLDPDNENVQLYFMPLLEKKYCLSPMSKLNDDKTELLEGILVSSQLQDYPFFQVGGMSTSPVVVRLDVAESLLRRNMRGFTLQPLQLEA